jgi:hypothetical protein
VLPLLLCYIFLSFVLLGSRTALPVLQIFQLSLSNLHTSPLFFAYEVMTIDFVSLVEIIIT